MSATPHIGQAPLSRSKAGARVLRLPSMSQAAFGDVLRPIMFIGFLIFVWELCVQAFRVPPYILPRPGDVANVLMTRSGPLMQFALLTARSTLLGLPRGWPHDSTGPLLARRRNGRPRPAFALAETAQLLVRPAWIERLLCSWSCP